MVMAEIVMGRNNFGPKISSHRQMAFDTFILKFLSVRQNCENRKLRTPFLFALLSRQKSALRGMLRSAFSKRTIAAERSDGAPAMQRTLDLLGFRSTETFT